MKIYVASSWRNKQQPEIVNMLREEGHDVYDFRHPEPGDDGFHWSEIDPNWKSWDARTFANLVTTHPRAREGFYKDMKALRECDACVLVMPCGRSAHLEAGYAIGADKPTCILLADGEPELMYNMADQLVVTAMELKLWCAFVHRDVIAARNHMMSYVEFKEYMRS